MLQLSDLAKVASNNRQFDIDKTNSNTNTMETLFCFVFTWETSSNKSQIPSQKQVANSKRNTRFVKYTLSLAICSQLKLERFEIISAFPHRDSSWRGMRFLCVIYAMKMP